MTNSLKNGLRESPPSSFFCQKGRHFQGLPLRLLVLLPDRGTRCNTTFLSLFLTCSCSPFSSDLVQDALVTAWLQSPGRACKEPCKEPMLRVWFLPAWLHLLASALQRAQYRAWTELWDHRSMEFGEVSKGFGLHGLKQSEPVLHRSRCG